MRQEETTDDISSNQVKYLAIMLGFLGFCVIMMAMSFIAAEESRNSLKKTAISAGLEECIYTYIDSSGSVTTSTTWRKRCSSERIVTPSKGTSDGKSQE